MSKFFIGFGSELMKLAQGYDPFGKQTAGAVGIPGAGTQKSLNIPKAGTQKSLGIPGSDPRGSTSPVSAPKQQPVVSSQPNPSAQQGSSGIRNPGLASQVQSSRRLAGARQGLGLGGQKPPPTSEGGPTTAPAKQQPATPVTSPVSPTSAPSAAASTPKRGGFDVNKHGASVFGGGGGSQPPPIGGGGKNLVPKKFDVF